MLAPTQPSKFPPPDIMQWLREWASGEFGCSPTHIQVRREEPPHPQYYPYWTPDFLKLPYMSTLVVVSIPHQYVHPSAPNPAHWRRRRIHKQLRHIEIVNYTNASHLQIGFSYYESRSSIPQRFHSLQSILAQLAHFREHKRYFAPFAVVEEAHLKWHVAAEKETSNSHEER